MPRPNLRKRNLGQQHCDHGAPKSKLSDEGTFWIEVAWAADCNSVSGDEDWLEENEKGRQEDCEKVEWWPAYIEVLNFQDNKYELFYCYTSTATTTKDIDYGHKHVIQFLLDNWLKHTAGAEKGKVCKWRKARWEEKRNRRRALYDDDHVFDPQIEIDELRGCHLELQQVVQQNHRANCSLSDRIQQLEKASLSYIPTPVLTGPRLKLFLNNAITTGLVFTGRDSRHHAIHSAFSSSHRQQFGKIRYVDCTLHEFRELARESSFNSPDCVSFNPSHFRVCAFNLRQKEPICIFFDTFYDLCSTLQIPKSYVRLLFQFKTAITDTPSVFQVIGSAIECPSKTESGTNEVSECIIIPGAGLHMLKNLQDKRGLAITRKEGKWDEQSGSCNQRFECYTRTAKEIISAAEPGNNSDITMDRSCYKLQWEALPGETSILSSPTSEENIPGKVSISIPVIEIRSVRAIREIEHILHTHRNVLESGGGWKPI